MLHRDVPFSRRDMEIAVAGVIHACKHLESLGIVSPRTWGFMVGRLLRVAGYSELTPEMQELMAESMKTAMRLSGASAQMEADTFAQAVDTVTPEQFVDGNDLPPNVAPFRKPGQRSPTGPTTTSDDPHSE
jgi:hypothetical protein